MPRPVMISLVAAVLLAASLSTPSDAKPSRARANSTTQQRTSGSVFHMRGHASRTGAVTSPATAAARGFAGPSGATSAPDGAGGSYVVWSTDRDGISDLYLQRVTSAGNVAAGWPATGLAVCTAPGMQIEAGLLPDGANGVIIGWADFRNVPFNAFGGTADLFVQRVNSAGVPQWTANGVQALSNFSTGNDLSAAPDGAGGAFLTWSSGFPGDIYANRVSATGTIPAGWSIAGVLVCGDADDQIFPVVAPDGSGGCWVAWEDDRGTEIESYAQHLNASGVAQWTVDGTSLTGGLEGYEPAMCADGAGGMIAFWFTTTDVMAQRYNSAGVAQWTAGGEDVGTSSFFADELWAWPDGSGGAYISWRDASFNTILYAQHVGNAGAEIWTTGGVTVCSATGDRFIEDAFVEAGGGLTLLWEDERSGTGVDLYTQKLNSTGVPQWTANGALITNAIDRDQGFSIATDGAGGAVAIWVRRITIDAEPYAQHLNSAGVAQLAANGKLVVADPGVQRAAVVVSDGAGGTWTAWHEKVAGDYQIRARRLDANGAPLTGTVTVCGAVGDQFLGGVVSDGAGGVVLGWDDRRGGGSDIYAQHLNASAVPQWTADGVAVCTAANDQFGLRMVSDGAGSAILTWSDNRNFTIDIYAQRLSSTGTGLWLADGVVVSTMAGFKITPVITPSGTNGAIIAWSGGGTFGQRLDGSGVPQWTAAGLLLEASGSGFTHTCLDAVSDGADGAVVLYSRPLVDIFGTGDFINTELRMLRANAAGASQWAADGVLLADGDAFRQGARLVTDGFGGAIAAWDDARGGMFDIYAQRVNTLGALQWGTGGTAVCNATSWQWLSGMAADGADGAVLAWSDERSGFADVYAQRVNSAGAAQWAANGVVVANPARGQYEAALHTDAGTSVLVWTDFRNSAERLLFSQKLNTSGVGQWAVDGVTATLFSMVAAEADRDRVRVTWAVTGATDVTAYRQVEGGAWEVVGALQVDGVGRVTLEDTNVVPGESYGYRIGMIVEGAEVFSNAVWIEVPNELALAIDGVRPQPARGDVWLSFTLTSSVPARLEVLDVSGRRVGARDLTGLGAGRHVLRLAEVPGAGGVYFVRVWQNGESVSERVVRVK